MCAFSFTKPLTLELIKVGLRNVGGTVYCSELWYRSDHLRCIRFEIACIEIQHGRLGYCTPRFRTRSSPCRVVVLKIEGIRVADELGKLGTDRFDLV
jgi:hypothetical protein